MRGGREGPRPGGGKSSVGRPPAGRGGRQDRQRDRSEPRSEKFGGKPGGKFAGKADGKSRDMRGDFKGKRSGGKPGARSEAKPEGRPARRFDAKFDVKPGRAAADVHRKSVENFARHGYAVAHRSGYSVGVNYAPDWGEGHLFSIVDGETRAFEPGMVFHLVPGIYVPPDFVVVISETVIVTEDGVDVVTQFPRRLFTC